MKKLFYFLLLIVLAAAYSCGKQRHVSDMNKSCTTFDFSLFKQKSSNGLIYEAHKNVPLGACVELKDLDNLFGKPLLCDTIIQTSDWALFEQETQAAQFMPTQPNDTLVMMRRIYGQEGNWLIWVDLEIQNSDSLKVLGFIAYDNSQIEM